MQATKIILPGVGAFDHAMTSLTQQGLIPVLTDKALKKKTPLLGVCWGAQILGQTSKEGQKTGLGWINMKSKSFSTKKTPIGWQEVQLQNTSVLFNGMSDEARFYFVHSYYMECAQPEQIIAQATCGHAFMCAVQRENIYGVQFHPEKSHRFGETLLKNFVNA